LDTGDSPIPGDTIGIDLDLGRATEVCLVKVLGADIEYTQFRK
jgi:hypothetical protein